MRYRITIEAELPKGQTPLDFIQAMIQAARENNVIPGTIITDLHCEPSEPNQE